MLGAELSLPLLAISFFQGAIFVVHTFFSVRVRKVSLVNSIFYFAVLVFGYNWFIQLSKVEGTFIDLILYYILTVYYTSILFASPQKIQSRFHLILTGINAVFIGVIFYFVESFSRIEPEDRIFVFTAIILMYHSLYTVHVLFKILAKESIEFKGFSSMITPILFSVLVVLSLLFTNQGYKGVVSMNIFFLGLVTDDMLRYYLKKQIKTEPNFDPSSFKNFNLSPKESEVADLILKGISNQEIADTLSMSVNTVHKHCSNVYKKTHTQSRYDFMSQFAPSSSDFPPKS